MKGTRAKVHAQEKQRLSRAAALSSVPVPLEPAVKVTVLPPIGTVTEGDDVPLRLVCYARSSRHPDTIYGVVIDPTLRKKNKFTKLEWTRMAKVMQAYEDSGSRMDFHVRLRGGDGEDGPHVRRVFDEEQRIIALHAQNLAKLWTLGKEGISFKKWTSTPDHRIKVPTSVAAVFTL